MSNLKKKVGFTPMTSIKMDGNASLEKIHAIAVRLIKQGLYVATEIDGEIQQYFPKDKQEREGLISLSLIKDLDVRRKRRNRFTGNDLLRKQIIQIKLENFNFLM
jgi:hypothetical protein